MKRVQLLAFIGLLSACSARPVETRTAAGPALAEASARLTARGIALDPAGLRPDRLRTGYFCRRPGEAWDATLTSPAPPPVPFTAEGTLDEQAQTRSKCPLLVQVEVTTAPTTNGARIEVQSAWWRLKERSCAPQGDPLVGKLRCELAYEGATGDAELDRFIYAILAGI